MARSEAGMLVAHCLLDAIESLRVALASLRDAGASAASAGMDNREITQLAQQVSDVIRRMEEEQ